MIWTIVLAAGRGIRFGQSAKQFERLGGRPLVTWSLDTAAAISDGVVAVVPEGRQGEDLSRDVSHVVVGGTTRSASVRRGLDAVPDEAEIVVVHDAARPLAPLGLYESVIDAVRAGADAAIPGLPLTDTIKRVADGMVVETLDRRDLVAVQTPQAFVGSVLRKAHELAGDATDDAALVEQLGGTVVVVQGDERALKVTVPGDLTRAEALL